MPLKVTVGAITDRGLNPKRAANEDRMLTLPDAKMFLVADGVGGRRAGQVASQTVVDVFKNAFGEKQQHRDLLNTLKQTLSICNQSIYDSSTSIEDLRGMATTLVVVAVLNDTRAIVGNVGDSRVYRFDGQQLMLETEDHSEVNEQVRAGLLSPAQAAIHPRRNVINRAIGAEPEVEPDFKVVSLTNKTSFLLCSDGITRHITDEEIAELFRATVEPQSLCERLKEICYERGAEDNLTAIVVDFGERKYGALPLLAPHAEPETPLLNGHQQKNERIEVAVKTPHHPLRNSAVDEDLSEMFSPRSVKTAASAASPATATPSPASATGQRSPATESPASPPAAATPASKLAAGVFDKILPKQRREEQAPPPVSPPPSASHSVGPGASMNNASRMTMLDIPEPEVKMPSMMANDRNAVTGGGKRAGDSGEASPASSITFWGEKQTPAGGKVLVTATAAEAAAATNAPAKGKTKMQQGASEGFTGRDMILLAFYLALLVGAFAAGRYYEHLLAWVSGEPVPSGLPTKVGELFGSKADPEIAAVRALFSERRFDEARKTLTPLVAKDPSNAEYQFWLGRAHYELKLYPDALRLLNEAARLDPKLPDVQLHQALAQLALRDAKGAEETLKRGVH